MYRFVEKLNERSRSGNNSEMPVIAFLGDSVTQGCFTYNDTNAGYVSKFRTMLNKLYPAAPAYVLNAGVGGNDSEWAYKRLERDVLRYHPDLVVVTLGLNDVWQEEEGVRRHAEFLGKIFDAILATGAEVIHMTPNAMNYYRNGGVEPHNQELCLKSAEFMNSGLMDRIVEAGKKEAQKRGIVTCDCYKKWRNYKKAGIDTDAWLCGGINHPFPELHDLFVTSLMDTLFELNGDL